MQYHIWRASQTTSMLRWVVCVVPLWRKLPKRCRHLWTNGGFFVDKWRVFADLWLVFADLWLVFSDLWLVFFESLLKPQKTQKNMVASDAITPIHRSRNRTPPIRHYFTDLFLISCPSFLLIFTITAVFDTSGGRRRWQPFFHIIPSLADSRPIVLSFINNSPAVLNIMFSITIGSA